MNVFNNFNCAISMDAIDAKGHDPYEDINDKIKHLVFKVQENFCEEIEGLEGSKKFSRTEWKTEGGRGVTKFLEHEYGVFEKVGVCASVAEGILPTSGVFMLKDRITNTANINLSEVKFRTAGVSGVVYPKNPHIPTLNFSYRYFEIINAGENVWWFGGSSDLIPYILHAEDCQRFHEILKCCCDKYDKSFYRKFKKNCDEHFYLKHRGERRGIGGIYFDDLNLPNKRICYNFFSECTKNILPSYIPIVVRNREKKYLQHDKEFQFLRRGRSAEFYLINEKATALALMTPGVNSESILLFLPPSVKWQYDHPLYEDTKDSELMNVLRHPREWIYSSPD